MDRGIVDALGNDHDIAVPEPSRALRQDGARASGFRQLIQRRQVNCAAQLDLVAARGDRDRQLQQAANASAHPARDVRADAFDFPTVAAVGGDPDEHSVWGHALFLSRGGAPGKELA